MKGDFTMTTVAILWPLSFFSFWWISGFNGENDESQRSRFVNGVESSTAKATLVFFVLAFVWIVLHRRCTTKQTFVLGYHALLRAVKSLLAFEHLLSLSVPTTLLGGTTSGAVYSWLAAQGGCDYQSTLQQSSNATVLTGWTYECTGVVGVTMTIIPGVAIGLLVWTVSLIQIMSWTYGARAAIHGFTQTSGGTLRHTVACIGYCQWLLFSHIFTSFRLVLWLLFGPPENLRLPWLEILHRAITTGRESALRLALQGNLETANPTIRDLQTFPFARSATRASEIFVACGCTFSLAFGTGIGQLVITHLNGVPPSDASGLGSHNTAVLVLIALLITIFLTIVPFSAVQGATEAHGVILSRQHRVDGSLPQDIKSAIESLEHQDAQNEENSGDTSCALITTSSPLSPGEQNPLPTFIIGADYRNARKSLHHIYDTIADLDMEKPTHMIGADYRRGFENTQQSLDGGISQNDADFVRAHISKRSRNVTAEDQCELMSLSTPPRSPQLHLQNARQEHPHCDNLNFQPRPHAMMTYVRAEETTIGMSSF